MMRCTQNRRSIVHLPPVSGKQHDEDLKNAEKDASA
jgi:hypothetical protein